MGNFWGMSRESKREKKQKMAKGEEPMDLESGEFIVEESSTAKSAVRTYADAVKTSGQKVNGQLQSYSCSKSVSPNEVKEMLQGIRNGKNWKKPFKDNDDYQKKKQESKLGATSITPQAADKPAGNYQEKYEDSQHRENEKTGHNRGMCFETTYETDYGTVPANTKESVTAEYNPASAQQQTEILAKEDVQKTDNLMDNSCSQSGTFAERRVKNRSGSSKSQGNTAFTDKASLPSSRTFQSDDADNKDARVKKHSNKSEIRELPESSISKRESTETRNSLYLSNEHTDGKESCHSSAVRSGHSKCEGKPNRHSQYSSMDVQDDCEQEALTSTTKTRLFSVDREESETRTSKVGEKFAADGSAKAKLNEERGSVEKEVPLYYNTRAKPKQNSTEQFSLSEEERKFWNEKIRLMKLQPLPVSTDNIGTRIEVREYGEREWRAMTNKSIAMRKGYEILREKMGLGLLRRIRGDNYCGVRSCLFQFFLKSENVDILPTIQMLLNCPALEDWNFARSFSVKGLPMIHRTVQAFLQRLHDKLMTVKALEDEEREGTVVFVFNDGHNNIELMEAGKLLMLAAAVELDKQKDSNLLAMLLFARDTSITLKHLVRNHLNCIGDSGGIDQLELSLLGYALKSKIRVFHPSEYNKDDFFVVFPPSDFGELVPENAPVLDLVAEDDRHYNVLLKSKNDQVPKHKNQESGKTSEVESSLYVSGSEDSDL